MYLITRSSKYRAAILMAKILISDLLLDWIGLSALIRGSETAMASVISQFGSLSSARFKSGCGSLRLNKATSPRREDNEVGEVFEPG
jgi:hypothetical protein